MELREAQEKRDRGLLRPGVAVPEPEERRAGQRGQAMRLAGDVHDAPEVQRRHRPSSRCDELEVREVVHLPVQLHAVCRGHRLPGDVHARVEDEQVDRPAVAHEAVRERGHRVLGARSSGRCSKRPSGGTARADEHRSPARGQLGGQGAADAGAAAGHDGEPAAQGRRSRRGLGPGSRGRGPVPPSQTSVGSSAATSCGSATSAAKRRSRPARPRTRKVPKHTPSAGAAIETR